MNGLLYDVGICKTAKRFVMLLFQFAELFERVTNRNERRDCAKDVYMLFRRSRYCMISIRTNTKIARELQAIECYFKIAFRRKVRIDTMRVHVCSGRIRKCNMRYRASRCRINVRFGVEIRNVAINDLRKGLSISMCD